MANGFTLIEVMIALAIVSIALLALLQSSHTILTQQDYLEQKISAEYLASDLLNRIQYGLIQLPSQGTKLSPFQNIYGYNATANPTPDPFVNEIHIQIRNQQKKIIFSLQGYAENSHAK